MEDENTRKEHAGGAEGDLLSFARLRDKKLHLRTTDHLSVNLHYPILISGSSPTTFRPCGDQLFGLVVASPMVRILPVAFLRPIPHICDRLDDSAADLLVFSRQCTANRLTPSVGFVDIRLRRRYTTDTPVIWYALILTSKRLLILPRRLRSVYASPTRCSYSTAPGRRTLRKRRYRETCVSSCHFPFSSRAANHAVSRPDSSAFCSRNTTGQRSGNAKTRPEVDGLPLTGLASRTRQ